MAQVAPVVVGDDLLYELATPLDPGVIADTVERLGSVEAAAAHHGLSLPVVQAAVDLSRAPPAGTAVKEPSQGLDLVKDLLGLFGGIAVLVYVAGGAVLVARLSYEDLPREAVFGQLPREFLLTVGVAQVLLPALIVAGLYSLMRAAVDAHRQGSVPKPRVDEARFRELVMLGAMIWWALLFGVTVLVADLTGGGPAGSPDVGFWLFVVGVVLGLSVAFYVVSRWGAGSWKLYAGGFLAGLAGLAWTFRSAVGEDPGFWITTAVALAIAVAAAGVLRDLYRHGGFRWRPGPDWLTLALTYGFVIAVAATAIAATFPFLDARACTSTGFREDGVIIGSGDRIFLGEPTTERRRIVSMPASDVEELFIGDDAAGAVCDPRGASAAVVAAQRAATARGHRRTVDRQLPKVIGAPNAAAARDPVEKLADSAVDGGRDALVVADAADSVDAGYAGDSLSVEARTVAAAGVTAIRAGLALKRALNHAAPVETLRDLATAATRRTRVAAVRARHLANRALNEASTAAPG